MPLYIAQVPGTFPTQLEIDFALIANNLGIIGDQIVPNDSTVLQLTFQPTLGSFAAMLLDEIVNNVPNNPIVVAGVDDSYILPNGQPITNEFGWTYWKSFPNLPSAGEIVYIFLDVSECSGSRYCACAPGGTTTSMPAFVMLFHELSHALHAVNGTLNVFDPEGQAISDENQLRREKGVLPFRDALLYGDSRCTGCGKCTASTPAPPGGSDGCFIISAAYESSSASQVLRVAELKEKFFGTSSFGTHFVISLLKEYYEFSPQVASDMKASIFLQKEIKEIMLEPLFDFLNFFEFFIQFNHQKQLITKVATLNLRHRWLKLTEAGYSEDVTTAIYKNILQLHTQFISNSLEDVIESNGPEIMQDGQSFAYLSEIIQQNITKSDFIMWSYVQPLTIIWSALFEFMNNQNITTIIGAKLYKDIELWLSDIPIPETLTYHFQEDLEADLSLLSKTLLVTTQAQKDFSVRLLRKLTN